MINDILYIYDIFYNIYNTNIYNNIYIFYIRIIEEEYVYNYGINLPHWNWSILIRSKMF